MLFLHGILGRGQNWRSIARRLVQAQPAMGAVLVDLRLHGGSQGLPGPHTVEAAARDVAELTRELGLRVRSILGHSFGGKIALTWARERAEDLDAVWLADSPPGARPGGDGAQAPFAVLDALEALPRSFESRDEMVDALHARGFSRELGRWLATNLERSEAGRYDLPLDVPGIRSMLEDYARTDLWDQVEAPPGRHQVHLVVGGRSEVFGAQDRERAARAAESSARVHLHVLEDAGHWLHVEAPDALLSLLTASAP